MADQSKYRKDASAEHRESKGDIMENKGAALARYFHRVCNQKFYVGTPANDSYSERTK